MTEIERHDFDVVIVGAGGAGLRAAIESRASGLKTAIICKSAIFDFGKLAFGIIAILNPNLAASLSLS